MTTKLVWFLAAAICYFVVTEIILVVEVIYPLTHVSTNVNQFRTREESLSQSCCHDGYRHINIIGSSLSRENDLPDNKLRHKTPTTPKAMVKTANVMTRETVIPFNVTGYYPMGVAIGKLIKVVRENGSSDVEQRVGNKYVLIRKIGSGSFKIVFLGVDILNGEKVAIKMDRPDRNGSFIDSEEKISRLLQDGEGFPKTKWSGREGKHNLIAIEFLGPSLQRLRHICSKTFSLKTVLLIADQLISRLEYMHSKHIINRDVKPHNFLIGMGRKSNIIYCVDFGLSKTYRDGTTLQHKPITIHRKFAGTLRYASINTQRGIAHSRRDDMESLAYLLIYLLRGRLPWQDVEYQNKTEKYTKVLSMKLSTTPEQLCEGFPTELFKYLQICRSMRFYEKPEYSYFRKLFSDAYRKQNFTSPNYFDWNVPSGLCVEAVQDMLAPNSSENGYKVL